MLNPPYSTPAGKYYRQSNFGFFTGAAIPSTTGSEIAALGMPNGSATVGTNLAAWGGTVPGAASNNSACRNLQSGIYVGQTAADIRQTATDRHQTGWNIPQTAADIE